MAKSSWRPKKQARQNRVLNFFWSFRFFSLNKSSKHDTETRQTRPQLHFAPKIIKKRLVVLENELVEVCSLILKKCKTVCQNFICVFIANSLRRPLNEHYVHETRVLFLYFFRISKQTSINSFSKATKCFLVIFGAKWSWGLACLVSVSCLLLLFSRKKRKLQKKFRTLFYLACFSASMNFSLCRPCPVMVSVWPKSPP